MKSRTPSPPARASWGADQYLATEMNSSDQEIQSPQFSVIIVNYNAGDRLKKCLDRLADQSFPPHEVIVVDNASGDSSIAEAQKSKQNFHLIEPGVNLGFAQANNVAAQDAHGDWLVFLNPDAYAQAKWLEAIKDGVTAYPWVDAFGSLQIDAVNETQLDGAGDAYFFAGVPYRGHYGWARNSAPNFDGSCFAPCAAAAAYRKATFQKLGGFEQEFFCYGEDVDLGFRLRLSGGEAVQLAQAVVEHEGSGITGRRSDFTTYHGHRNRIWTYIRCMPTALLIASLPFHIAANIYLCARFAISGDLAPYLKALRDAVAGLHSHYKARQRIQSNRQASLRAIASALTWSPLKMFKRQSDLRVLNGRCNGPNTCEA